VNIERLNAELTRGNGKLRRLTAGLSMNVYSRVTGVNNSILIFSKDEKAIKAYRDGNLLGVYGSYIVIDESVIPTPDGYRVIDVRSTDDAEYLISRGLADIGRERSVVVVHGKDGNFLDTLFDITKREYGKDPAPEIPVFVWIRESSFPDDFAYQMSWLRAYRMSSTMVFPGVKEYRRAFMGADNVITANVGTILCLGEQDESTRRYVAGIMNRTLSASVEAAVRALYDLDRRALVLITGKTP